jgi:hypothetical protein
MTTQKIVGSCKIVDVSKLFVSPLNTRFQKQESETSKAFVWLCNSIKSEGLVEPLIVRPVGGQYEIVAGTRRFAALKHIGATQAPTVVREMSDQDVRIASLIENIHRLDLSEDEKEYTMKQIYLTAWEEWVNPDDLKARPFTTDEDKLALAKSYLNRIWNVHTGAARNYSKVTASKFANETTKVQKVFPTDAFEHLSARVGYAVTTQINILRGYGAIDSETDFYDELPPTYKEIADRIAKEKKLLEAEKQAMSKRMLTARKKQKHDVKHPKTQKEKAETAAQKFANKVERERKSQERKREEKQMAQQEIDLQKSRQAQAKAKAQRETQVTEQISSAVREREKIADLGHELFQVLTGQEAGNSLEDNETFVKNTVATQTMQQLVTFVSGRTEILAQQNLVIPLTKALSRYRDMLYDAGESQKGKERMSGK